MTARRRVTESPQAVPELAGLAPAEASEWVRRLERTAKPCGCKSGAALMLVAVVSWPAWVIASGIPRSPAGIAEALAAYFGLVAGSAVVGKLAGILAGRVRHRRLQRRLRGRLAIIAAGREA
jgi:hypothetical protein